MSVPETNFDRHSHTHYRVTRQTAQANQMPEILVGAFHYHATHHHTNIKTCQHKYHRTTIYQWLTRHIENQNSYANDSINRLADAIAGHATQQRPEAITMLKPVSTNTIIFDGKNEKLELFEGLFHTMLEMQSEMTEAMKLNNFHAHLRKEALQTFRNKSESNKKIIHAVLIVFRRKCVKTESQATTRHKWHKLTFDPNTNSPSDFLEELNDSTERTFGNIAQLLIGSLLYAKLPPHLKRSLNLAYLENGIHDQIVAHLVRKLELSGLESDGDLTKPTMTHVPPNDSQQTTEQTKIV